MSFEQYDESPIEHRPSGCLVLTPACTLPRVTVTVTPEVVDRLFREESGRTVATLIRQTGDFDIAEDAVQDAFVTAIERWPQDGLPRQSGCLDQRRRRAIAPSIACGGTADLRPRPSRWPRRARSKLGSGDATSRPSWSSARNRRTPSWTIDYGSSSPAVTRRWPWRLGSRSRCAPWAVLQTPEIARAFLVPERDSWRSGSCAPRRKIRDARHPLSRPADHSACPSASTGVLRVLYLVFNEGYDASSGDELTRIGPVSRSHPPHEPRARGT